MTTSLIPCCATPTRAEMNAAFAILRVDGQRRRLPDTITGYRGVVEIWVNWCIERASTLRP